MRLGTLRPTKRVVLGIALGACLSSSQVAAFGQVRVYPEPQQMEVLKTNLPLDNNRMDL